MYCHRAYTVAGDKYADVHGTYFQQSSEQKTKLRDDDDDDDDDDNHLYRNMLETPSLQRGQRLVQNEMKALVSEFFLHRR